MSDASDIARAFAVDLIDGLGNVRESVARVVGTAKRGAQAARVAGQITRARFEGMLDDVAERLRAQGIK